MSFLWRILTEGLFKMDTKSKLACIKKLRDNGFLDSVSELFHNGKFNSYPRAYVRCKLPNGDIFGEMDISCIKLIDPSLDVTYFVEDMYNMYINFDKNRNITKVIGHKLYKDEQVCVDVEQNNMKISFQDEHFIELDYLNFYKITNCSNKSVIDSELFRRQFKTFDRDVAFMLEMTEF